MKERLKNGALALSAVAAGLLNSLIGAGGGIILSFTLGRFFPDKFPDKRNIYVNSQAAMIPGCALSCYLYSLRGMLDIRGFSLLAIPAAIGGFIGSLLLPRLKVKWLKGAFAALVIWSGIRMILAT